MRKLIILLNISCCITCFSCTPDKCCYIPGPSNFIRATRNGSDWTIDNTVGRLKMDSLIIADTSVNPQRTELLAFKLKFTDTASYNLNNANIVYGYVPQMDNPYVYYTLDPNYPNTLKISFYDVKAGFVAGDFDIRLIKDPANTDERYPATVSFLNGSFSVHLSK